MEGKANLYYALGELAYAVAIADGKVQKEERKKIHDIVVEGTAAHSKDIDVSEIIFHILQKDKLDWPTAYDWALKQMRLYDNHLTADMKVDFVSVLDEIAHAFNSVTIEEKNVIDKFQEDLKSI